MGERIPPGYRALNLPGASGIARVDCATDFENGARSGTLHDFARGRPDAKSFRGRGDAWAFVAPGCGVEMIVRRSRHGGMLAPITGELFFPPGRARNELELSIELASRGIPTPEVLGFVTYPVTPFLCRIDVVQKFIPAARDLASLLSSESDVEIRMKALASTSLLLNRLAARQVLHPDLNMRNVLIAGEAREAWVLDIDRVLLDERSPEETGRANSARIIRSARKLSHLGILSLSPGEMESLASFPPKLP